MAQQATIDEAVFSMSSAHSSGGTTGSSNTYLSNGSVNTLGVSGDVINKRCFPWGLCRVLISEVNAVTD
jgi:hypothetical protein